jgi:hypothetical protein
MLTNFMYGSVVFFFLNFEDLKLLTQSTEVMRLIF